MNYDFKKYQKTLTDAIAVIENYTSGDYDDGLRLSEEDFKHKCGLLEDVKSELEKHRFILEHLSNEFETIKKTKPNMSALEKVLQNTTKIRDKAIYLVHV